MYKYFDYFANSKHILYLTQKPDSNYAFFITSNYLNNQQEITTLRTIIKKGITPNIKFINLEGWSDGINLFSDNNQLEEKTLNILAKSKKLAAKNPVLTFEEATSKILNNKIINTFKDLGVNIYTISNDRPATKANILSQINPFEPSKEILKNTIEAISKFYVPNEFFTKGLSERLAEYYENSINVYSKQGIIENLKIIKSKIDDFLIQNKLSNENLYFIVPKLESTKSYDIIMKMYQNLYNIPQEKIISLKDINQLNSYNKNTTFVLLDDMVGSGNSMTNAGGYSIYGNSLSKDKHILFAPIAGCIDGIDFIKAVIHRVNRSKTDSVIYIKSNLKESQSLKNIFQSLYFKIDNPTKYAYGCEGYDMGGLCTIFPYMTPDNNSSLASDIAKFFVPNHKCIRNLNLDMKKIEEKSYYYNIFGKEKDDITIIQNK